jgi:hypothetical protein
MTHFHSLGSDHPGNYSIGSLYDHFTGQESVESLTKAGNETPPKVAETVTPCSNVPFSYHSNRLWICFLFSDGTPN